MKDHENESNLFSHNGKCFIKWNFNNPTARMFREMKINKTHFEFSQKVFPRYINHIESFDFNLDIVNICLETNRTSEIFSGVYFCQMNVFEKIKDLEKKLSIISNGDFDPTQQILKVKGYLAFFYGSDPLIDFEAVYNAVIREEILYLETYQREPDMENIRESEDNRKLSQTKNSMYPKKFVYFWKDREHEYDSNESYQLELSNISEDFSVQDSHMLKRNHHIEYEKYTPSGECENPFYVNFCGWRNLHKLIEFILSPEVDIPLINKAEMVIHDYQLKEKQIRELVIRLNDEDRELLRDLSNKFNAN